MQNESFMPSAGKYGLFGGFSVIIVSLIMILLFDPSNSSGLMMVGILSILVSIAVYFLFCFLAIKNQRDYVQDGYITFGHALITGFVTSLIIALLGTAFSYIYHNMIDPSYFASMASSMAEFLEDKGLPEEQIEEIVDGIKQSASPKKMVQSIIFGSIFGLIMSLISAAILKKNPDHNILA